MRVRATATIATAVAATAIAAGVVGSASGSDGSWRGTPGGAERSASARGQQGRLPTRAPIGVVSRRLARLDPLTLELRRPRLELSEFHDNWSFSPDRSRVALGMGGPSAPVCGAGICIVDLASMRVVQDIDMPICAEAVGWVSPRRVVAVLCSGEVFVADPVTGRTVRRRDLPVRALGPPVAETPSGFAVVVGGDPARLAEFDARGRMRVADLERIRLRNRHPFPAEQAGLAVDPARERAFVFAARAPAAEVNLRTMEVRYHRVKAQATGGGSTGEAQASVRSAVWLGRGRVAVSGTDFVNDRGAPFGIREVPAGVNVINTETWRARTVSRRGTRTAQAAGRLLVWRSASRPGGGVGLRIYTRGGRRLLAHRFGDERLNVHVVGGYAYALGSRKKLGIVRVRSGRVVHRSEQRVGLFSLLLSCRLGSRGQCGG